MLTLTHRAETAIREILSANPLPDGAGVRIAADAPPNGDGAAFRLSLVDAPEPEDRVVEGAEVPVYVEQAAAPLLEETVLDAEIAADRVTFSLAPAG